MSVRTVLDPNRNASSNRVAPTAGPLSSIRGAATGGMIRSGAK
jgi:hypothetical protein